MESFFYSLDSSCSCSVLSGLQTAPEQVAELLLIEVHDEVDLPTLGVEAVAPVYDHVAAALCTLYI